MTNKPPAETPAKQLRDELRKHRRSPWVAVGPLATILPLIEAWVIEVERRDAVLAASQLRAHFGVERHAAQLEALASMGDDAYMVLRAYEGGTSGEV